STTWSRPARWRRPSPPARCAWRARTTSWPTATWSSSGSTCNRSPHQVPRRSGRLLEADCDPGVDGEERASVAGALGLLQFLPGSIRRYAVNFDGDERVDLTTPADAIGSVANFLAAHGWVKGGPIVAQAQIDDTAAAPLLAQGIQPRLLPTS